MNRQIYTYTDLRSLKSAPFWNQIRQYPQITVSANLRKSLKGAKEVFAWEFRKLSDAILPHWTDDETKFHETIVLTQFVRQQIAKFGDDIAIRHWLVGCRRNLGMILSSIILLEEADISPEDLHADGDRNLEFLLQAWDFLKSNDPAIGVFHKRMEEMKKRSAWDPVFNKLFGRTDIDTLVFHGFYYITPLQERVMRLLEGTGIRLIFLFPYEETYPYANEIWRKTYSAENGYPHISGWNMEKSSETEPYGEIFEGRKAVITNRLQIREYTSTMEFVHGMKHAKEQGYEIYSSDANAANKILRDFYPDEYGERKLLSYPIGQFVSTLNQMWDEDRNQIILDEDRLMECFASGWLAMDGISGKQYLQDLNFLMPFFADCRSVEEWKSRICLLREIKEHAVKPFEGKKETDENQTRWQEVMENPFLNFSPFAVEAEKLEVILKLTEQLLSMAEELFAKDRPVKVKDHIKKLDMILKQHEMSNELYEEEREIVKDLFEKLGDPSGFTAEVFPADISGALNLYMSGRFQEGEIRSDRPGMVSWIYQMDAVSAKQHGKVHICLCDVEHMPGGKKEYIWPLTGKAVRECYDRTGNPLIWNLMHVMESTCICNRYFMYTALKNQEVQLSWVSQMEDKLLAPSPYIRLLSEAADVRISVERRDTVTYRSVQNAGIGRGRTKPYDVKKMPEDTVKEARMDYALCPMKYALGYVTEKYPVFQNEFHQNYAVNGLIAAIYSLMKGKGMSVDEIYHNVIELFPAMRKVEKRQVYDYLYSENSFHDMDFEGRSELGDLGYSEERLKVRFPNKNVREQALEKYEKLLTPDGKTGMDFYTTAADLDTDPYKKVNTDVCLFCQHQGYCRYAVFAADAEELYD